MSPYLSDQDAITRYKAIYTRRSLQFINTGEGSSLQLALLAYNNINIIKRAKNPKRIDIATLNGRLFIRLTRAHTRNTLTTKLNRQAA
ncbi:MAG: hypothetical protein COB24_09005 [Hyphomicrobiales bacterium]|nr:MAG: hypothetical protein COB24_09005 [Hyphomicrobiales bacterium]